MIDNQTAAAKHPTSTTLYFGPWYRRSPFCEVGTDLIAVSPHGELPCRVAALPFIDPKKSIPVA